MQPRIPAKFCQFRDRLPIWWEIPEKDKQQYEKIYDVEGKYDYIYKQALRDELRSELELEIEEEMEI